MAYKPKKNGAIKKFLTGAGDTINKGAAIPVIAALDKDRSLKEYYKAYDRAAYKRDTGFNKGSQRYAEQLAKWNRTKTANTSAAGLKGWDFLGGHDGKFYYRGPDGARYSINKNQHWAYNQSYDGGAGSSKSGAASTFSAGGGAGGDGGDAGSSDYTDWQSLSNDAVADRLGIKGYKYEDILANLDQAAAAKYNEIDTTLKRMQSENLRGLEENYSNYVNTLRADKANAISSGITKGQAAAMQILSGINGNKAISDSQQKVNDEIFKATQERGTMLADNKNLARTQSDAWQQYLATLKSNYQANEVNEYAADTAAMAQRYAADAQTRAAGISAGATRYAAATGGNSELEYLKFLMENPVARTIDAGMRK